MPEYIKLKSVIRILDNVMSDKNIKHKGKAIRKRLKELPAEDVEKVVRCKDCKNFRYDFDDCGHCYAWGDDCTLNDFCSYGKRKEGTE